MALVLTTDWTGFPYWNRPALLPQRERPAELRQIAFCRAAGGWECWRLRFIGRWQWVKAPVRA